MLLNVEPLVGNDTVPVNETAPDTDREARFASPVVDIVFADILFAVIVLALTPVAVILASMFNPGLITVNPPVRDDAAGVNDVLSLLKIPVNLLLTMTLPT